MSSVEHYENFPVASILMPRRLRKPVAAIYHFARAADDIADEGDLPDEERLRQLDGFRAELARIAGNETSLTPLFHNLAAEIRQHALPMQPLYDLLDAFSQDVVKKRYADFDELLDYCRRSANPVGTLLLHLYEEATPVNIAYSDAICTSLQLINFWQDVAKDYAIGRIYRAACSAMPRAACRTDPMTARWRVGPRWPPCPSRQTSPCAPRAAWPRATRKCFPRSATPVASTRRSSARTSAPGSRPAISGSIRASSS